ncbi:MAG: ester cyclase [Dehalococcoidia bacterium]|nr:ester cyclase [Dehalococcoidia bacterium]
MTTKWEQARPIAERWWKYLTPAEKLSIALEIQEFVGSEVSLAPGLPRGKGNAQEKTSGTISRQVNVAFQKALAAGLFGDLFASTDRTIRRVGLLFAYLLVHPDVTTHLFEVTKARNLEVVESYWQAINTKDWVKLRSQLHPEYAWESDTLRVDTHSQPQIAHGQNAGTEVMKGYFQAFPDLKFTINHILASGNIVVTRWVATGTQRRTFMGVEPTNMKGAIRGCSVDEIVDGKIIHAEVYWDTGYMFQQLGLVPEKT